MTAATALCTSNNVFYSHPIVVGRSSLTSVIVRPSPSSSPTANSRTQQDTSLVLDKIKSDENNNDRYQESSLADLDDVLYITSDDDDDVPELIEYQSTDQTPTQNTFDQDEILAFVGLRPKGYKPIVEYAPLSLRPLNKRAACPVCLLPLTKYSERVRQALTIRLPFLKFLRITRDIEKFCSTDEDAKAQSLLPRSAARTRNLSPLKKRRKTQKLSKTALINLASEAISKQKNGSVHSILQCHVSLDRLEQSTIEQLIQNSTDKNLDDSNETTSMEKRSSRRTSHPSSKLTQQMTTTTTTCTMITTTTKTEKTFVKRKSTASATDHSLERKRFKSTSHDLSTRIESDPCPKDSPSLMYERIYLKCFICSKRQYISAQVTDSNTLHTHWLAHGGNVLMNIYDSEVDSILTRVVEFFKSSKQHTLEGKIRTVFILDSKEIRRSPVKAIPALESYIIID